MLVNFLMPRVAVLAAAFMLCSLFIAGLGLLTSIGIALGAVLSLYKTRLFAVFLMGLSKEGAGRKAALFYAVTQALSVLLLTAAVIADFRLFAGVAAGLLTLPLFILINTITEKTGVTHNRWGDAEEAAAWKQ